MNNFDSKDRFTEIKLNSHYLRVDDQHPLELLIGINDEGQKTVRLIGDFTKTKIRGTKTIEVNHYKYKERTILSFSLIDDEYEDIFYLFCNDLIDTSRNLKEEMGYTFLVNRFERWRSFSGMTRKYLSENEIKGLIGELFFLNDVLIPKYGVSKSIEGWTGTEPLKKDFSYDATWYEIKAITNDKVSIASIEQLDSKDIGYLVVYYLEKLSSEANGLTLKSICNDIFSKINFDHDRQMFIMKLVQANFYLEDYYDQFVYVNTRSLYFEVNKDFPKLVRENLFEAISNVKYELIVNMLESYRKDYL